jgi:hypothetical protein
VCCILGVLLDGKKKDPYSYSRIHVIHSMISRNSSRSYQSVASIDRFKQMMREKEDCLDSDKTQEES